MSSNNFKHTPAQQLIENTTQKRFIEFLIKYGDLEKAAKAARITPTQAKALVRHKSYERYFIDAYRLVFLTELAPSAVLVLKDMLSGRLKTDRVKADIAKTILDRIGLGAIKPDTPEAVSDMEAMNVQDLELHLQKLKREAADSALVIDAQHIVLDEPQDVDYID